QFLPPQADLRPPKNPWPLSFLPMPVDRFVLHALGLSAVVHLSILGIAFSAWEPRATQALDPPEALRLASVVETLGMASRKPGPLNPPELAAPRPAQPALRPPVTAAPRPAQPASKPVAAAPRPAPPPAKPVAAAPRPAQPAPKPVAAAPKPVAAAPKPVVAAP